MIIKMTALKLPDESEVFRLKTDTPIDVVVTDDAGTEQIQNMFIYLLDKLISNDVEIEFEKTPDYGNEMYENVCKDYIQSLNRELKEAREALIKEGYATGEK